MNILTLIAEIRTTLIRVFDATDSWFDKPEALRQYRPASGGWTIDEILEHVSLTSHFLLILIDKGAARALQLAGKVDLAQELAAYNFHRDKLDEIGLYRSFEWIRPEHMEPGGLKSNDEVRALLTEQRDRCLRHLAVLKNGEGVLYRTTMTVNNLGKIDVYEYIYFLAMHAARHLRQMEKNEAAFGSSI